MPINDQQLLEAISAISSIESIAMDADDLADDIMLVAYVWPTPDEFKSAIANTCRALSQIASRQVSGTALEGRYRTWFSYHYQHKREKGAKADMRINFQRRANDVVIKGFGHRYIPVDIYARLNKTR